MLSAAGVERDRVVADGHDVDLHQPRVEVVDARLEHVLEHAALRRRRRRGGWGRLRRPAPGCVVGPTVLSRISVSVHRRRSARVADQARHHADQPGGTTTAGTSVTSYWCGLILYVPGREHFLLNALEARVDDFHARRRRLALPASVTRPTIGGVVRCR